VLRSISTVVVDEVQNISDPSRGANLEFLLTLLRAGHSRGAPVQVIALSAVVGDTNGFESWLGAGLLKTETRPVPLRESVIDARGTAMHHASDGTESQESFIQPAYVPGGEGSKQIIIPLVQRLIAEGKKVIVFRSMKGQTVGTAGYLAQYLGLPPATSVLSVLPTGDLSASSQELRHALQGGVGFHNADLDRDERSVLEVAFRDRDSDLKVLVSTTTLAMGVNTPAEAVVIAGLQHPFSHAYSVAEYKNMAGRAGRPGFATSGESFIVASDRPSPSEAWRRYVLGRPEPILSHFLDSNTDPQNLIIRALAVLGRSVEEEELVALLENSYAIWALRRDGRAQGWNVAHLRQDLEALILGGLVDREPTGVITLTALGAFAGESGLEVRSVARVSSALRFVDDPISMVDLLLLAQVTVELDQVYMPRNKKSRQEMARWPNSLVQVGCSVALVRNLHVGGGDSVDRAKKAVAAIRYVSPRALRDIEAEMTVHMREAGIAGPIRGAAQRTRDVVTAVAQIAMLQGRSLAEEDLADIAMVSLETGAPASSAHLAMLLGNGLTRADYLALHGRGITDEGSLHAAGQETLASIVGDERAEALWELLPPST
jgi:helicase